MSPDVIEQAVANYFAAIRAMDLEAWIATFDENAVSYEPVGTPPLEGHEALRQFFCNIAGAFEKVGITEDSVFVAGDEAAVKWTGRGMGKNGAEVIFEGIDIFQVNQLGKIQKICAYWNPAAMMAQLR